MQLYKKSPDSLICVKLSMIQGLWLFIDDCGNIIRHLPMYIHNFCAVISEKYLLPRSRATDEYGHMTFGYSLKPHLNTFIKGCKLYLVCHKKVRLNSVALNPS